MARYSKIDPRMYGDEGFRSLSRPRPNAQTLWTYLITGPHTTPLPGLWMVSVATIADAHGWSRTATSRCLDEVTGAGMASVDQAARVVLVQNRIAYDPPQSPNVIRSWRAWFDAVPESALKAEWLSRTEAFVEGLGEAFGKAFREAFGIHKDSLPERSAEALPKGSPNPQPQPQPQPDPTPPTPLRGDPVGEESGDPNEPRGFPEFWDAYPRKVGRGAAVRAYRKACRGHPERPEAILAALQAQVRAQHFRGRDGQDYVPNPATWLNQGRWGDTVGPASAEKPPGYDALLEDAMGIRR